AARDAAAASEPLLATELMVSYAYDTIAGGNPVGFFGMVLVLEGTSAALATRAATSIESSLGLPRNAFSYLLSHGDLDVEHVGFFESLMDRLDDPADQAAVIHPARRFYVLYGDIFRALPAPSLAPRQAAAACRTWRPVPCLLPVRPAAAALRWSMPCSRAAPGCWRWRATPAGLPRWRDGIRPARSRPLPPTSPVPATATPCCSVRAASSPRRRSWYWPTPRRRSDCCRNRATNCSRRWCAATWSHRCSWCARRCRCSDGTMRPPWSRSARPSAASPFP